MMSLPRLQTNGKEQHRKRRDQIMFRQAAAGLLLEIVMVILPACGGDGGGTTAESPAPLALVSGTATLSWDPVTTDTSGKTLMNLAGYKIHYGTSAQAMSSVEVLDNPNQTTYVLTDLVPGTWFFAVSAYTTSGEESGLSDIASKTIS
jgi:hypothetical protein